jgi:hypothetical protein
MVTVVIIARQKRPVTVVVLSIASSFPTTWARNWDDEEPIAGRSHIVFKKETINMADIIIDYHYKKSEVCVLQASELPFKTALD